MSEPAISIDNAIAGSGGLGQATSREDYLDRLSALLGVDRTRMIASAWSGGTVPSWLRESPPEAAPVRPARRRRDNLAVIRQTTMACVAAALGSCLFLYWGKSQAAMADREIGRIVHATEAAHARVYALRAEWALLNQPDRLADMASHYLKLQPVAPAQFAEIAKLQDRLQAPVATSADGSVQADAALALEEPIQAPIQNAATLVKAPAETGEPKLDAPKLGASKLGAPEQITAEQAPAIQPDTAERDVPMPPAMPDAVRTAVTPSVVAAPSDKAVARMEVPPEALSRHGRAHAPGRAVPESKYPTSLFAEARQPVRVRDSGEALLNGDPDAARQHTHIVRASAYAAASALMRADQAARAAHRLPAPRIDLPHWLMEAHLVRPGRSDPPHTLGLPQNSIAMAAPPEAAPPVAATVQRVIARPVQEPEHPPIPEARQQAYEPAPYRPMYRRNFAYGYPRPYYGRQNYGGQNYGGQNYGGRDYYGNSYGGGYGSPYYDPAYAPRPPNAYYQ